MGREDSFLWIGKVCGMNGGLHSMGSGDGVQWAGAVPELQPVACAPDVMETWKAMRFSKQKRKLVKGSTAELGCVRASQLRVVITSYGP